MKKRILCTFLAFLLVSSRVFSADVKVSNDEINTGAIFITGPIEKGDYEKVEKITRSYIKFLVKDREDKLKYILNSEGGDVEEAIKIGLLFRRSLAKVYVWGNMLVNETEEEAQWILGDRVKGWKEEYFNQNNIVYSENNPLTDKDFKKCYSACVLMFLGGVEKQINDNYYWIDGVRADEKLDVPVIGLHRPYYSKDQYAELSISDAESMYRKLEKQVRQYLEEVGASQVLIDRIFKSSSNEIDLVNDTDFRAMINLKEPYFSEWILAKCGASSDGENLLSKDDYEYKNTVLTSKTREVSRMITTYGGGPEDYTYVYEDFIPDGFSKEKYEEIRSIIGEHNLKVFTCEETAVKNHQIEMFSESTQ